MLGGWSSDGGVVIMVRLWVRVRLTSCLMLRYSARTTIRISGVTYLQSCLHVVPYEQGSKGANVFLLKVLVNRTRRLPNANFSRGAAPSAGPVRVRVVFRLTVLPVSVLTSNRLSIKEQRVKKATKPK